MQTRRPTPRVILGARCQVVQQAPEVQDKVPGAHHDQDEAQQLVQQPNSVVGPGTEPRTNELPFFRKVVAGRWQGAKPGIV